MILDSCEDIFANNSIQEMYILGLTLFELGYINEGMQIIQNVLKKNNSEYVFDVSKGIAYLGLGSFSVGNYELAKKYLLKSSAMGGDFSNESQNWITILHLADKVNYFFENDFLRFYFVDNFSKINCDKFIDAYTSRYNIIQSFFDVHLPKKIDIFIYSSHKDEICGNLSYANPPLGSIHVYIWEECGHELTHVICYYLKKRINFKAKFINEGVAECFNIIEYNNNYQFNSHIIDIFDIWNNYENYDRNYANFIAKKFCLKLLKVGGKQKFIELICEQSISNAYKIYGKLLYDVKNDVENEVLLGINC